MIPKKSEETTGSDQKPLNAGRAMESTMTYRSSSSFTTPIKNLRSFLEEKSTEAGYQQDVKPRPVTPPPATTPALNGQARLDEFMSRDSGQSVTSPAHLSLPAIGLIEQTITTVVPTETNRALGKIFGDLVKPDNNNKAKDKSLPVPPVKIKDPETGNELSILEYLRTIPGNNEDAALAVTNGWAMTRRSLSGILDRSNPNPDTTVLTKIAEANGLIASTKEEREANQPKLLLLVREALTQLDKDLVTYLLALRNERGKRPANMSFDPIPVPSMVRSGGAAGGGGQGGQNPLAGQRQQEALSHTIAMDQINERNARTRGNRQTLDYNDRELTTEERRQALRDGYSAQSARSNLAIATSKLKGGLATQSADLNGINGDKAQKETSWKVAKKVAVAVGLGVGATWLGELAPKGRNGNSKALPMMARFLPRIFGS